MTDIDFDELDKAVNSLMGQANAVPTKDDADQSTQDSIANPPVEPAMTSPIAETKVNNPSPSIVQPNRPGRIMDIVHPAAKKTRTELPKKGAVFLEPVNNVPSTELATGPISDAPTAVSPVEPVVNANPPAVEDFTAPALNSVEPVTPAENTDQLSQEMSQKISQSLTESMGSSAEEIVAPATLEQSASESSAEEPTTTDAPLGTPFLENAVVEKRPLGGYEQTEQDPVVESAPINTDFGAALDAELMKIENSSLDTEAAVVSEQIDTPAMEGTSVESESTAPEPVAEPVVAQPAPSDTSNVPPLGDIRPQYTPDASTTPDPVPMFDAAAEQPAPIQEKKSSGWLTVVVVILLLMIGAGGGVAAYFMLTQ